MSLTIKINSRGKLVKAWQEFLNISADGIFGKETEYATITFQNNNGLTADGIAGHATFEKAKELGFEFPIDENRDITEEQLAYIMNGAKHSDIIKYIDPLNTAMNKYVIDSYGEINSFLRQCHFLAQVGHESGSLKYSHELASGKAYEGRADLGNIYPGDGMKYKGQGLIQLTGRNNITSFGKYVGIDFAKVNPARIGDEPELSAEAAGWFWMTRKLNKWADLDDIKGVTLRVNGGYNGLEDRKGYLKRAKEAI
jgi:predicted chitinase